MLYIVTFVVCKLLELSLKLSKVGPNRSFRIMLIFSTQMIVPLLVTHLINLNSWATL